MLTSLALMYVTSASWQPLQPHITINPRLTMLSQRFVHPPLTSRRAITLAQLDKDDDVEKFRAQEFKFESESLCACLRV